MKPPLFAYHAPRSLDEAVALLAAQPNARVIAGGQSLMPMLNMRVLGPDHLVDLGRIPELAGIREENGEIHIGAMTRQRDIEFSPLIAARLPLLAEAILWTGHRQTRNRGTIGGSLCHLDPSAEQPTVAMAMDAILLIAGPGGRRELPMHEFAAGLMTNAMAEDEILAGLRIRPWAPGHGWAFVEFARRHGDFAMASAAALIELDGARRVARASITLGGVVPTALRMTQAEGMLTGEHPDAKLIAAAAATCADIDALEDPHAPAWYRQRLARTLTDRALKQALERALEAADEGVAA